MIAITNDCNLSGHVTTLHYDLQLTLWIAMSDLFGEYGKIRIRPLDIPVQRSSK